MSLCITWYAEVSHGMCSQILNRFHVLSGQLKSIKNMEEYAQELEIPAVSLSPDIPPYMFSPLPRGANKKTVGQRTICLAVMTVDRLGFFQPKMLEIHFYLLLSDTFISHSISQMLGVLSLTYNKNSSEKEKNQ